MGKLKLAWEDIGDGAVVVPSFLDDTHSAFEEATDGGLDVEATEEAMPPLMCTSNWLANALVPSFENSLGF